MERGLKQAEVDGRRKAEEVQAVKNKVASFVLSPLLIVSFLFVCIFGLFWSLLNLIRNKILNK